MFFAGICVAQDQAQGLMKTEGQSGTVEIIYTQRAEVDRVWFKMETLAQCKCKMKTGQSVIFQRH